MSITDLPVGRMAQASARSFGARRLPPAPAQPEPRPIVWPAVQAAKGSLRGYWARVPGLLLASAQALAPLPVFSLNKLKSAALALKPRVARSREATVRALLRSDARATFLRLFAYIGVLAALAAAALYFVRSTPMTVASNPWPAVEWLSVDKPFPIFSLPLPELSESGYDYALRRHASAGGRQDILTWGELQGTAPHLVVEISRPGAKHARFDDGGREIATRLAAIPAEWIKPAGEMETKFGAVSLVEFSAGPERQCLGFVRAYEDPPVQILGWHCVSGSAPVESDLTACALDRLVLLSARSELKLRELFARAELKRHFCGQRDLGAAADRGRDDRRAHGERLQDHLGRRFRADRGQHQHVERGHHFGDVVTEPGHEDGALQPEALDARAHVVVSDAVADDEEARSGTLASTSRAASRNTSWPFEPRMLATSPATGPASPSSARTPAPETPGWKRAVSTPGGTATTCADRRRPR